MNLSSKIYIAGHRGLAGSAIARELQRQGYTNIVSRFHAELDLEDAVATRKFLEQERPEIVFLAAAKVGGILANNTYPVEFLMSNLLVEANVCRVAHATGVNRLIFLGSSCIYPRDCPQPIKEEYLLTGPLEATKGKFVQDTSKPDGTMRKVMDVSKIQKLGWKANTSFKDGIDLTYKIFKGAQA